jgi:serine/threonine protein kinase
MPEHSSRIHPFSTVHNSRLLLELAPEEWKVSNKLCKNCGKPPLAEHAGSVTSFFFQHNYCQCAVEQNIRENGKAKGSTSSSPLCSNCGKSRPTSKRAGSFTSFLFKELRCSCPGPNPAKPNSSDALEKIRVSRAGKERTQTAHRLAQKKQFTESLKNRKPDSGESAAQVILSANTIIGGTYRILSLIGMGGMGVVYLVEQTSLHKHFALKVLSPDLVNEQNWQRFKAEAKTMASLNHPSFVNVYDLGIHAGSTPFYSMDYLTGRSLEEILVDEGPLKLEAALNIFIEVLNGLAYAHRNGIIHRDIKPANIMICTTNGATQAKILDFGISKLVSSDASKMQSMTMAGDVFGSPYYMSPEQCAGEPVDASSDIYSIGCTLFEVLTGYVPFEGSTSLETMIMHQEDSAPRLADVLTDESFPKSLEAIVATCLAKLPRDRYQSAKEVVLDLERIREGKEIEPSSPAYRQLNKPTIQKSDDVYSETSSTKLAKTIFLSAAAMAMVILVVAGVSFFPKPANQAEIATKAFETDPLKMDKYATEITRVSTEEYPNPGTRYYFSQMIDGGRTIQFNFPINRSIGKIGPAERGLGLNEAQYTVTFPASYKLQFRPYSDTFDQPKIFNSFRPSDLHSLIGPEELNSTYNLKQAMPFIAKLTEIRSLNFRTSNIGDEQVVYLNQMPKLESLDLSYTRLTGGGIAKLKRLKNLRSLNFGSNTDCKALLLTLAGSEKLQRLSLDSVYPPLSASDVRLIVSCKNIHTLNLNGSLASDETLQILSGLPNLSILSINDCVVSQEAIKNFKKSYPAGQVTVNNRPKIDIKSAFENQSPADWSK